MTWLRSVVREILGLFVDDLAFVVATLAWLVACGVLLPRLDLPAAAKGPIFFAGLAVLLIESAARRARK